MLRLSRALITGLRSPALKVARAVTVVVILILLIIAIKIPWVMHFRTDGAKLIANAEKTDVLARRAYLVDRYRSGLFGSSNMPALVDASFQGEWALGTCNMLVTALTNIAYQFPETRPESVEIANGLTKQVLSAEYRHFDTLQWQGEDALASLDKMTGHIGYLGQLNFMLAANRLIGGNSEFDNLHGKITEALAKRLREATFPYLETYPGKISTVDNIVVIASLKLYDEIFGKSHGDIYTRWLTYTQDHLLDPRTGLVAFRVASNGKPAGLCRGSGIAWNGFYLPFIDKDFAQSQYGQAKKHLFKDLPLGTTGLLEYAAGTSGVSHSGSRPFIFGLSTSGTGVIVASARHAKDESSLNGLLLTAEIAGSSVQSKGKRHYLLAPVAGDAIMLAMKTAQIWDNRFLRRNNSRKPSPLTE